MQSVGKYLIEVLVLTLRVGIFDISHPSHNCDTYPFFDVVEIGHPFSIPGYNIVPGGLLPDHSASVLEYLIGGNGESYNLILSHFHNSRGSAYIPPEFDSVN